jgi:hypothetical protein
VKHLRASFQYLKSEAQRDFRICIELILDNLLVFYASSGALKAVAPYGIHHMDCCSCDQGERLLASLRVTWS